MKRFFRLLDRSRKTGRHNAKHAARALGARAENWATFLLRIKFYRILARNYKIREGEIDIIAQRGATIVFVEVKARPTLDQAAIAITPEKMRRMSRAARHWIATHPWAAAYHLRGDAIFFAPRHFPRHIIAAAPLQID